MCLSFEAERNWVSGTVVSGYMLTLFTASHTALSYRCSAELPILMVAIRGKSILQFLCYPFFLNINAIILYGAACAQFLGTQPLFVVMMFEQNAILLMRMALDVSCGMVNNVGLNFNCKCRVFVTSVNCIHRFKTVRKRGQSREQINVVCSFPAQSSFPAVSG